MKNKEYRLEKLRKQLSIDEGLGKKYKEWELTPEQVKYVQDVLGYETEVILYRIKTKQFHHISLIPKLIKEIHFACKRGKWMMKKPLTNSEIEILDNYDIRYSPVKFRIQLKRQA